VGSKRDGDAVGLTRSFIRRSAERQRRISGLKNDVTGISSCCAYRWALDRISKLYDGCIERLRR